jgi:hypothetical protein
MDCRRQYVCKAGIIGKRARRNSNIAVAAWVGRGRILSLAEGMRPVASIFQSRVSPLTLQ